MNTKFFFALLVMALLAAACAPIVAGGAVPMDPAQPKDYEPSAPAAAAPSDSQEPRLWSGSVSLSDNNSPDHVQPSQAPAVQNSQSECVSEDTLPRRHGGCVE